MGIPKRKPWICAENGCFACQGKGICDVPGDCAFVILHALELMELGLQERPRRWGKTHTIAECVAKTMAAGAQVVVVCRNVDMGKYFGRLIRNKFGQSCPVETADSFPRWARDKKNIFVFADELTPDDVSALKLDKLGFDFVLGYYTEKELTIP